MGRGFAVVHIYGDELKKLVVPIPPIQKRESIIRLLDYVDRRIRRYIGAKQKLIVLLEEQKETTSRETFSGQVDVRTNRPYSEYKPSGVQWLGPVPTQWKVRKLTDVTQQETGHTPSRKVTAYWEPAECVIPWLSLADVWQLRDGKVFLKVTKEKVSEVGLANSAARLLPKNTVVLSRTASVGFAAILDIPMATTQDFAAWICGPSIKPVFLYYVLTAMSESELRRLMIGATHQTIYMPDIRALRTPLPTITEQESIVRFLDYVDPRVQHYIQAKQNLIALLEEQKQIIIHQAVTGQIDVRSGRPYPAYKESGVEWLGELPEHWEVAQLRRVAISRCDGPFGSGLKSSHYTETGIRVVRLQNIGHGEFIDCDKAFISPEHYASLGDHSVVGGDILIAGLGDDNHPVGRACVAPAEIAPAMVKADCFRFRLDPNRVHTAFVACQLTATARTASAMLSTGATRQRTNLQSTAARAIGLPTVPEQKSIAKYIADRTSAVNATRHAAERESALATEFHTRLISDVVTGKLDVREITTMLEQAENPNRKPTAQQ